MPRVTTAERKLDRLMDTVVGIDKKLAVVDKTNVQDHEYLKKELGSLCEAVNQQNGRVRKLEYWRWYLAGVSAVLLGLFIYFGKTINDIGTEILRNITGG
jgi:hypothetical protein